MLVLNKSLMTTREQEVTVDHNDSTSRVGISLDVYQFSERNLNCDCA